MAKKFSLLKQNWINHRGSYCISEIDSYEPLIYFKQKQVFRLKAAAVGQLKIIERDLGCYFEIRDLRLNTNEKEDKN